MTRLVDLIIPPATLDLPADLARIREVMRHDHRLVEDERHGLDPWALDLSTGEEVPVPRWYTEGTDPDETGESEDVHVFRPLDELRDIPGGPGSEHERAAALLSELDGKWITPAGEWSPLRWAWLDKVSSRLYVLGFGNGGGCTWDRHGRRVALGYPRLCLPAYRRATPWSPDRTHRWVLRPYLLGRLDRRGLHPGRRSRQGVGVRLVRLAPPHGPRPPLARRHRPHGGRVMECPHGSDAATCPPCRRDAQAEPTVIVTRRFAARFDGQCPGCNLPLAAGADARSVITDGHRVTYHDGCEP